MTVTTLAAQGEFRIGHVISRTWKVMTANFWFYFIVMMMALVPVTILDLALQPKIDAYGGYHAFTVGIMVFVVSLVLGTIAQTVITAGSIQHLSGEPVRPGKTFQRGLARYFPYFGLVILGLLALIVTFGLGFVLLIVAFQSSDLLLALSTLSKLALGLGGVLAIVVGLVLVTLWAVAGPVCLVEGKGPIASLGRSRHLTKGRRWKIFGLLLLVIIVLFAVAFIIMLGALFSAMQTSLGLSQPDAYIYSKTVVTVLLQGVGSVFWYCLIANIYHDLRVAKEGITSKEITAVFD